MSDEPMGGRTILEAGDRVLIRVRDLDTDQVTDYKARVKVGFGQRTGRTGPLVVIPDDTLTAGTAVAGNDQHLRDELAYWMARAQRLEQRLRVVSVDAADTYRDATSGPDAVPPEPPVGTSYRRATQSWWWRRDDGWHCARPDCRNCPAPWSDVWDAIKADSAAGETVVRLLPGSTS